MYIRAHPSKSCPDFYPRPHMEGDLSRFRRGVVLPYFYPRPHMEGDFDEVALQPRSFVISTHALTWRAT